MIIDQLNLNHLRIFEAVIRARSVTAAAQELHLTQSGVSQHLKAFEEMLGIKLFDRIKGRMVPTAEAQSLFERCQRSLHDIEQALVDVKSGGREVSGSVTIGMPIEFGHNVILPLLADFGRKHPLVRLNVRFGFAGVMSEALVAGEMDFAFVDDLAIDRRIETLPIYNEVLELCISSTLAEEIHTQLSVAKGSKSTSKTQFVLESRDRKVFEAIPFVDYQKDEAILRNWFQHHLGTQQLRINLRATVVDVQGVARLVMGGLGAGVLSDHLIQKLQKEGQKIEVFRGRGQGLKNTISSAWLRERSFTPAAFQLREWLNSQLRSSSGF
jgi:DNA-binding transcriptional LysR family regulator